MGELNIAEKYIESKRKFLALLFIRLAYVYCCNLECKYSAFPHVAGPKVCNAENAFKFTIALQLAIFHAQSFCTPRQTKNVIHTHTYMHGK